MAQPVDLEHWLACRGLGPDFHRAYCLELTTASDKAEVAKMTKDMTRQKAIEDASRKLQRHNSHDSSISHLNVDTDNHKDLEKQEGKLTQKICFNVVCM